MRKILLYLSIAIFLFCLVFFRHYLHIFYFQNDLNKIAVNIEMKQEDDIYICFDENCEKLEYKNGVYYYKLNQENHLFYNKSYDAFNLISSKKTLSKISKIDLFEGNEYREIKLENNKIKDIQFLNEKKQAFEIKINPNDKTIIQKIGIYFLSLFYNWYFYLFGYIFLLVYFFKEKAEEKYKIKYPMLWVLLLAILLRLSHIDFVPLWNDELYTLTYISNMGSGLNLDKVFLDAGNPPLFFILSNIWLKFFNESVFQIRFLPFLIGVFQVYFIYFAINKIINKKVAILSAFLSATNIFLIVESNEIRSYILAMVLILWGLYQFNNLKNDFSNKNIFLYFLVSACLINTHYYCILYVLANFILGLILFKNNKIKFLLASFFSFLTFLPYFILTFKNSSLDKNFNVWIEKPSLELIYNHIIFYFGNILWFLITIIACVFAIKFLKDKKKEIFIYNIYSISLVFIFALVISIILKPILFERYFCIFLPLLIINTAILLDIDFKTRIKSLLLILIFLFSINIPKYENFNLFSNIYLMAKYSSADFKNQKYEAYFVIPDKKQYVKYFSQIPQNRVIVSNYGIREDIDLIDYYLKQINYKKGDKVVLYLPEICINSKIKFSNNLNIRRLATTIVPVYKIYIE